MKRRKILAGMAGIISLSMALAGCGDSTEEKTSEETEVQESAVSAQENYEKAKKVVSNISYTKLTRNDVDCTIVLDGKNVQCDGEGAVYEDGVVTISKAGCYEISGTLEDGRIEVDAGEDDEVQVILNGVEVSCSDYAPFVVWNAKQTNIYMENGTDNAFTDAETYKTAEGTTEDDTPSAVIYSKDDIVFGGSGNLKVTALCNDGISGRDDVQFVDGTYEIEAADDGIVGKDSLAVWDGTFTISAGGDGMKSTKEEDDEKGFLYIKDGSYTITAAGDAFQAETYMWISDGEFAIETGGGCTDMSSEDSGSRQWFRGLDGQNGKTGENGSSEEEDSGSNKGLKAGADVTVEGGTFTMDCADDAVHSNETVTITGGTFDAKTGDDGIHADCEVVVVDGNITFAQCYEGIESTKITISGGKIDITATDDGINASSGTSSGEGDTMSEMGGRQDGDMEAPEMPTDGAQMPDGAMNGGQMPDGAQNGQMPEMGGRQDGDMEAPEMPTDGAQNGQMPEMGGRQDGDMEAPEMPTDAAQNGQMPDMAGKPDGDKGQNPQEQGNSDILITISGGEIYVNARGDGLDSNGSICMTGGTVYVDGPENDGNGIIDYESSFEMQGGTLIGAGSSGMLQTISDNSTQAGLAVVFDSSQSAGTTVSVKDSNGNEILSYQPSKAFSAIVLSTDAFKTGETYGVYLGDTLYKEIELTSVSTTSGSSGMGGGMSRPDGEERGNKGRKQENSSDAEGTI